MCLFLLLFAWGDISRKMLLRLMSESKLCVFSSRSSVISGLTFKFLIHFELILCVEFLFFLPVTVQFPQHHLLKKLFFLQCMFFVFHCKLVLFLGSLFSSIYLCICFSASTMLFWLLCLCNIVWNQLCSFSSGLLWLCVGRWGSFYGSMQIIEFFVLFLWKTSLGFW